MTDNFLRSWMWSEACDMLVRAERLHRQFFEPGRRSERVAWEPPVDVLETPHEVIVFVALPGVRPEEVELGIEGAYLLIAGTRRLPHAFRTAAIHRMELPQGHFFRRVLIPGGQYGAVKHAQTDGLLVITLVKEEHSLG